ncbi:MAG: rhomboid family intramembrane serine protease [Actinomycetia bacterium]|nr:rhomboid family intramembrane serine protease [Actinomycetes bacterium]
MREGKATTRATRTLAGGAIHGDPVLVTKILLAANVVLFVLQYATNDRLTNRFAMQGFAVAVDGEWWRLVTSAFLHTGVTHLAFNMLALWFVGSEIEPRLGRWRYLTVYLLSALGGSVLSYAVDSPFQTSVGASGAVFGLFGALFVLMRRLRFDVGGIIGLIVVNVVIGFLPGLNINWRAHLGGLIVGTVLTAAMVYAPQRHRLSVAIGASFAIFAVCVAVTVWRTDQINACLTGTQNPNSCINDITYLGATGSAIGGAVAAGPAVRTSG